MTLASENKKMMCDECNVEMEEVPMEFVDWDMVPQDVKDDGILSVWACRVCSTALFVTNKCECCEGKAHSLQ